VSDDGRCALGVETIISGGQTGVDRAALDVALALGIHCGGWCPRGRRAEDGTIPRKYPLRETPSTAYAERTAHNVHDADATLVLCRGPLRGGTALTLRLARRARKPSLTVDLDNPDGVALTRAFLASRRVRVLNVAGPRESQEPGIAGRTREFLFALLKDQVQEVTESP